jgi:SSS family solute:Na+ symporter
MSGVRPEALSLIRPASDPSVPWPGLLFGIPVLGFYYWCTNQSIVQRVLSARDVDHARRGALFAGLLKLPVLFLVVMPGICALLLYPDLKRADSVYPTLILDLLPPGAIGLVVGAFVASTMVAIASMLNSASTLITMDVIKRFRPAASDAYLVRAGRISTAALLVLAVAWAPQLEHFSSLWQYLQGVLAYAVPPVVAVFLLGLFWRGATATGAAVTMLAGTCCGLAMFFANVVLHWTHLHFLYVAPLLLVLNVAILVGVSLWRPAPLSADSASYVWRDVQRQADRLQLRGQAPWRDYRYQAVVLLVLTGILVYEFR